MTLTIETGELETAPSLPFVRIPLLTKDALYRVAEHYNEIVHVDKKGGAELQTEYAVYHLGRCYFYEETSI